MDAYNKAFHLNEDLDKQRDFSWTTGFADDIKHQCLLARGGYGEVHKMTRIVDGTEQIFARKLIRPFGGVTSEDIENEARAVTKLCKVGAHPNIVEVLQHGWLPSQSSEIYFFDMECCEQTLEDHMNSMFQCQAEAVGDEERKMAMQKRIQTAFQISWDITCGLEFIHDNGEVHRDLKPLNVLYSLRNLHWKIADFGISSEATSKQLFTTRHSRGTATYRAPEILDPQKPKYNNKADIWALGCIVYEAFTGEKAFASDWDVFTYQHQGKLNLNFENLDTLVLSLQEPLYAMLSLDPAARPTAKSLRSDVWQKVPTSAPSLRNSGHPGEILAPCPPVPSRNGGVLNHSPMAHITFVTVNISNTRFALVSSSDDPNLEECIQVRAPSDPGVYWEQRRPILPGPHLISFSEGGKFLVFRKGGNPKVLQVLSVDHLETTWIIWVEENPVAIAFSDGHRLAIAVQRDGYPSALCEPLLPGQWELTPTVCVSEDIIKVDMSGERGTPEIFYSGDWENIFLVQWVGRQGGEGDLEITGWNISTRSCVTQITYPTNFRRWPNEFPNLTPCGVSQNYLTVRGRLESDLTVPVTLIIPLTPGNLPQEVARHNNVSFAVTVPAGFMFVRGRIMELWTPLGIRDLGELDCDDEITVEEKVMTFILSNGGGHLIGILKDGSLRIFERRLRSIT